MLPNKLESLAVEEDEAWLSALLDGELDDDAGRGALSKLDKDAEARRKWAEYSLVGDVLRGQGVAQPGLSERLTRALENEPTILAPVHRPRSHQPVLWLAAAASVAAVSWVIWTAAPQQDASQQLAIQGTPVSAEVVNSSEENAEVMPYLAAHQDYAQALVSPTEMHFTRVTLTAPEADQ